jgi:hypothetical protein
MITALQNFISKQSKFLFPILLLVIVVSFVLYLSQGSSVFDLLPDPNRERKELYGVDLNDPDQRRLVTLSNRVASDFGAIVSPTDEAMENADRQFLENLQSQIQAAFQANQQDIDRNALQRLFGFMQQWPNLPKSLKVKEIARSGLYDFEFSESSAQSKITLDGQADDWGFLPLSINHPKINLRFDEFLRSLDPGLNNDDNRSLAMQFVGRRHGFSPRDVETILYSQFRALEIDKTYSMGGLSLKKEAGLDLHGEQFAWDAEVISLQVDDLDFEDPEIANIRITEDAKAGASISISYGNRVSVFELSDVSKDKNGTRIFVEMGKANKDTLIALTSAIEQEDLGVSLKSNNDSISVVPQREKLPSAKPVFESNSKGFVVSLNLEDELFAYHTENKEESIFAEPARTFATALTFSSSDYMQVPPAPDNARMISYFERNKDQFVPPVPLPDLNQTEEENKGAKGPVGEKDANSSSDLMDLDLLSDLLKDANDSTVEEVTFDQVRDQVRQRIIDGDRIDAERYAETAARDAALAFLDDVNSLQDKLRNKYSSYQDIRESSELNALILTHKSKPRAISFADRDMPVQGAILGLETRESEKRSNRQPLEEVKALSERSFFTRSVRKARDGYIVFLFDKTTESGPGDYQQASFRDLYSGYTDKLHSKAFQSQADIIFDKLEDLNSSHAEVGVHLTVSRKSASAVRAEYDKNSGKLSRELTALQNERNEISNAERENNATSAQLGRKEKLDLEIQGMRDRQAKINRERSVVVRLVDACPNLEYNGPWEELERTDSEVIFVRLYGVYSIRSKLQSDERVTERVIDLEFARAEKARGELVQDLIDQELNR